MNLGRTRSASIGIPLSPIEPIFRHIDVTSVILLTRSVDLTSLPIARIVLILKAELFLRTTAQNRMVHHSVLELLSVDCQPPFRHVMP